jgi:hypothetical protein
LQQKCFSVPLKLGVTPAHSVPWAGFSIDAAEAAPQPSSIPPVPPQQPAAQVRLWRCRCALPAPFPGETLLLETLECQAFEDSHMVTPCSPISMQFIPRMYVQIHPSRLHHSVAQEITQTWGVTRESSGVTEGKVS